MTRRILLMCDYGAFPLWTADGAVSLDADEVPIGRETRLALTTWAARYDRLAESAFRWPERRAEANFDADGRRLWRRIQAELGAEWEVGYFSQLENRTLWPAPERR